MKVSVFIGVGSNINPEKYISKAMLDLLKYAEVIDISTHYLTKAEGNPGDPDYINGVWKIKTDLKPEELKYKVLRKIENDMGRIRKKDSFAPRKIDLDILLYSDIVIDSKDFKIPSGDIYKRPFVCFPIYELEPQCILPDTGMHIYDITKQFKNADMIPLNNFTGRLKLQIRNTNNLGVGF